MAEYVRTDSSVYCIFYTSGTCCYDSHYDLAEVTGEEGAFCGAGPEPDMVIICVTKEPQAVNCKECLELMHS